VHATVDCLHEEMSVECPFAEDSVHDRTPAPLLRRRSRQSAWGEYVIGSAVVPCLPTGGTNTSIITRVPHISHVFREMWDTANLDLEPAV